MKTKQASKEVESIISNHMGFKVVLENSFKTMLAYELAKNGKSAMLEVYEKQTTVEF